MPLHEAVKSVERKVNEDVRLFTNPTANHDLRISDALREVRRDVLKLQALFTQPLQLPASMNIPRLSELISHHSLGLVSIQKAADTVYYSSADFSRETRGLKPLVNAESEIRDATTAAEIVGTDLAALIDDKEVRDQLEAHQLRTVDVGLDRLDTDPFLSSVEPNRTLQAGGHYQLRIHIGNPLPGSLMQGPVPYIDPLLPDPKQANGHPLEIAVQRKEFELLSQSVKQTFLPRFGAAEPVYFTIRAPRESGTATLRICVYYRNYLLQSFLLQAEITHSEEFRNEPATRAQLEYSRTERFTNLDDLQARAISIGANLNQAGDTHELFIKGAKVGTVPLGDKAFTDAMDDIRAVLLKATVDSTDATLPRIYPPAVKGHPAPSEMAEVTRRLADKGHELYNAFFRAARFDAALMKSLGSLRDTKAETIQVVRFYERVVFPWVLLYDFEPPETGSGNVCLGQVLDVTGVAQSCGHGPRDKEYCIRGFWGIRHRVEELIRGGPTDNAVKVISRLPGREFIRIVTDFSVPGAPELQNDLQAALDTDASVGPVDSQALIKLLWKKPPERPAMLLILGHLETGAPQFPNEPKGERIVLVPQKNWLTGESISNEFNAALEAWDQPRPLVLLMACGSATTNVDKVNDFVIALNAAGAGAIVGTECVVFSDFASAFARYLTLRLWNRNVAGQATSLGQAMTEFRVQTLESGNPLAFVFRSIGDADLTLQ
jgi:hypothetical protein